MATEARMKVLIAIDTSDWANRALEWYAKYLHQPNNEVICFHCAQMPILHAHPMSTAIGVGEQYEEALRTAKENIKRLEEDYAEKMKARQMFGKLVAKFAASPGEAVIEEAKAQNVQMIVIGTRGLGKVRRTILGSVSDYVIHHSHCPVVICCHEH